MSAAAWMLVAAALVAGAVGGFALGAMRGRARVRRLAHGLGEMARGNYAHRVILPGSDDAALAASRANELADAVQRDLEGAAEADAARVRLLANVSHDLRTPITSIAGYVDALVRGLGEDPGRHIAVIAAKTDELARLTDDLFYEARLESGDLDLRMARTDLAEATRRCLLGFEPQLTAAGVRADIRIPETACPVHADPAAVERILANVVSNALRHGRGMSALSVSVASGAGACRVTIADDGPALPGDPERLFERGVAGPAGGAGLGLSIARELAERMGGSLTAGNREDGASFTLELPQA